MRTVLHGTGLRRHAISRDPATMVQYTTGRDGVITRLQGTGLGQHELTRYFIQVNVNQSFVREHDRIYIMPWNGRNKLIECGPKARAYHVILH